MVKGQLELIMHIYVCPFLIMSYICIFGGQSQLNEYVEYAWKLKRYKPINNGIDDNI